MTTGEKKSTNQTKIKKKLYRNHLEMAFFNLTALGPQSIYKSSLKNRSLLHIFEEVDIQNAFDQVQVEGTKERI